MNAPRAAVAILAGGSGSRVGAGTNKVYLDVAGRTVLGWSLHTVTRLAGVVHVVLVIRPEDQDLARGVVAADGGARDVAVVVGGATRHASEDAALAHLRPLVEAGEVDVIVIHDGARPLAGPALWDAVIRAAHEYGGALPAIAVEGLLPEDLSAVTSAALVRVQTPQAFRATTLLDSYAAAGRAGFDGSDTSSCVEAFGGVTVRTVPGSPANVKVTWGHDLVFAQRLLAAGYVPA